MQSLRNHIQLLWVLLLLGPAACSHAPVRQQPAPAPEAPTRTLTKPVAQPDAVRLQVISTAYRMLGTPYRYGGAGPAGFDCSGLVWYSHRRAGIQVPRTASLQHRGARQRVSRRDMAAGDLLFFDTGGNRSYHVGIYVGDGKFIHAPSSGGKVSTASLENNYWRSRFLGAGNYY